MSETDAQVGGIAAEKLQSLVSRIERLEEERKGLADDLKDIYTEAESSGFDKRVLRQLIRIRKMDPTEAETMESLLHLYMHAVGGA